MIQRQLWCSYVFDSVHGRKDVGEKKLCVYIHTYTYIRIHTENRSKARYTNYYM